MSTDTGDDSIILKINTSAEIPRDSELKKSSEEGTNVDGDDGCSGMDMSVKMSADIGDDSSVSESNMSADVPRNSELKKSSEKRTNVDGNDGFSGMDISIDEVNDINAVDLQRLQLLPLPKIPGMSKSLILEQMELLTDRYDFRRLKRKEDVKMMLIVALIHASIAVNV